MKILAATPAGYSQTRYIVELVNDELSALTSLHRHGNITVTDADGKVIARDKDKLVAGDVISPDIAKETLEGICQYLGQKDEIEKAFATVRGAMTKLQNLLPKKS